MHKEEPAIFFFIPFASIGGTEKVHLDILRSIHKNYLIKIIFRYRVNPWMGMAAMKNSKVKKDSVAWKNEFLKFGKIQFASDYLESKRFGKLIRKIYIKKIAKEINRIDNPILIFWHRESIEFLYPYLESHVKLVDIIHNNSNNEFADPKYLINDWAERLSKRVLISQGLMKWVNPLYNIFPEDQRKRLLKRIFVIPHSVFIPESMPNKNPGILNVIYVGRNAPEKRLDILKELVERFEFNSKIHFHLVGFENDDTKIRKNLNVTFYGILSDESILRDLYSQAHLLVLTSSSEGFPKVIAESMAFGVVPLVTNVGGISEQLENKELGFLIEDINVLESMEKTLIEYTQNLAQLKLFSQNAYIYAKENFDFERFKKQWLDCLISLSECNSSQL